MATHSGVLAWRIPGTGEPGGLPSIGLHSQTRLKRPTTTYIHTDHNFLYILPDIKLTETIKSSLFQCNLLFINMSQIKMIS